MHRRDTARWRWQVGQVCRGLLQPRGLHQRHRHHLPRQLGLRQVPPARRAALLPSNKATHAHTGPPPGRLAACGLTRRVASSKSAGLALPARKTAVWVTGYYPGSGGLSFASCGSKTGKYCDLITAAGLQVPPPPKALTLTRARSLVMLQAV